MSRLTHCDTVSPIRAFVPGPIGGGLGGLDIDGSGQLDVLVGNQLKTVDTVTGATTDIGAPLPGAFESFEIVNGRGYSANVFDETLYEIDLGTGLTTAIGPHGQTAADERVTGLAHDGSSLYGTRIFQRDLVEIDLLTGALVSVIGVHGLGNSTSLAYADGQFWTIPVLGGASLYSLNPLTGAAQLVHANLAGLNHVTGLTARPGQAVPEPGTLALAGVALWAAGFRRLRRRKLPE